MQWTKPEWTEIPVGMEIGAYRAPEPEEAPLAHPPVASDPHRTRATDPAPGHRPART